MAETGRRKEEQFNGDSLHLEGIIGLDLTIKAVNPAWERLLGYPEGLLLEKMLTRLVDQNEHAAVMMLINSRSATPERPIEFSFRCRDGSYRCFLWERRPVVGRQAVQITGKDITERKKMETTANLQRYMRDRSSST